MNIEISVGRFVRFSVTVILLLLAAGLAVKYAEIVKGHGRLFGLVPMFDLNAEQTVPVWFQSGMLAFAGVLAALVASDKKRVGAAFSKRWRGLSVVFLAMSLDELVSLHELAGDMLAMKFNFYGRYNSPWLIFAVPFVIFFAFVYLKFFFALPPRDRSRFLAAAAVYLGGVILVEAAGGAWTSAHGEQNMVFAALSSAEELFEMLGQMLLVTALLQYIRSHVQGSGAALRVVA